MLLAFGSVVAMGLPILTALVGVGMGFGILVTLSHLLTVPTFGPDLMAMIGLGVGIDYALFIVTRYRQGLAERAPPRDAAIVALSTAGRAVLFAGATVVISLLGLFVVGLPFMDGLAVATIVAVAAGAGRHAHPVARDVRLRRARPSTGCTCPACSPGPAPPPAGGSGSRWSRTVQTRPGSARLAALAVLVVLAVPLFSMRLAFSDAGNDPTSLTTRQAYDLLADGLRPRVQRAPRRRRRASVARTRKPASLSSTRAFATCPAWPRPARRSSTPPATPRSSSSIPPPRRSPPRPRHSSTGCATR